MMQPAICNSTLEELRISPGSEQLLVGPLTFHDLALIIAGSCTVVAISLSIYLAFMHAINYTKPREQKHIIRILFMVPVYATSSFLQIKYYWHAIYFQVISDCYEAFAIASFFALMCHYMAPDLHDQKQYFRLMQPVKPWVWPTSWFAKCCGGERGPWRTPKSGLTWFNIIWIGIYQYCFIRVAMTLTAVVTQSFGRYCESSNHPFFAHIWVISINCLAVTIAMYCVIQFYVQLRQPLAEHRPFLKVLAIKLVIFFSFWQATAISVGTSARFNIVQANAVFAYPDIKVGWPGLILCFEMSLFAILHLWAFPYSPYVPGAKPTFYPCPDQRLSHSMPPHENLHSFPSGGPLGIHAFIDAANLWDYAKAFGRGIRWLFCGIKRRKEDVSYDASRSTTHITTSLAMDDLVKKKKKHDSKPRGTAHLPIANEFRRSRFGLPAVPGDPMAREERVGLIANAQPNPVTAIPPSPSRPPTAGPLSPYHDHRSFEQEHHPPSSRREERPRTRGNDANEWAPSPRRQGTNERELTRMGQVYPDSGSDRWGTR